MNEEKNNTEKAWSRLYQRLEDDNLISDSTSNNRFRIITMVSAAAIIIIISMISYFASYNDNTATKEMYAQDNTENSTLVTTLSDGSVVYISKGGEIKCPVKFDDDKREIHMNGEAFFDVAKNASKPFIITTANTVVRVVGTSFNIISNNEKTFQLSVRSGKVKVTDRITGKYVYVLPGQTVRNVNNKLYINKCRDDNMLARYTKDIRFKDEPLKNIVDVMNQMSSDTRIELSPQINDRRITVAFAGESTAQMARLISLAMGLRIENRGNVIYLSD